MTKPRVIVKKSEKTINLLTDITVCQHNIASLDMENKVLKKLCFFGNDIESQSTLKLSLNALELNRQSEIMFEKKESLFESHNLDYFNTMNNIEAKKEVHEEKPVKIISSKKMSAYQRRILDVLTFAKENDVRLSPSVMSVINKEIA